MEGSLANELYSESLRLSNLELDPISSASYNQQSWPYGTGGGDSKCQDDGFSWGDSDDELDREGQRRHDQFHTIGYREGLLAGKEASAQEGFNIGLKQSVISGYKLGLVRGVSSALACLPDDLRDKLIETQAKRDKFHHLFESVHSLSTADALKLFDSDFVAKQPIEREHAEGIAPSQEQRTAGCSPLDNYFNDLKSLLHDSPSIIVHLAAQDGSMGAL